MATKIRTQQVSRLIRRVWVDEGGRFQRAADPTLGQWGRGQVESVDSEQHDDVSAATLYGPDGTPVAEPAELHGGTGDSPVRISYRLASDERLYGAYDADQHGLQRRGDHVHLVTELHPIGRHLQAGACDLCGLPEDPADGNDEESDSNYGEIVVPLVLSSRGYAVYVANTTSRAVLDLGQRDPAMWTFSAPAGHADFYLIGPAPLPELVRQYTRLTGMPPLPPTWALGYLQSRFGYESFDHAHRVLQRFADEQLAVHGMIFDVQWLDEYVNYRFNRTNFPDPTANLARIADRGTRVVVISEPGTRRDASNFEEGLALDGAYAQTADGRLYESRPWFAGRGIRGLPAMPVTHAATVNFFNERACDWWYDQHLPLLAQGVDAWWIDLNEPEGVKDDVTFPSCDWPYETESLPGSEVRNVYALAQQRALTRRDRAHTDRRPFLLSRAAAAGSQRYGTSPWSGDVGATWEDLQRQPRLLLTAGLCGQPLWSCDVGGFNGDPGPELFARWMQLGAFLPVFRAHGEMRDREPWSQGTTALEAVRAAITLRAQLLPSIATWAYEALSNGRPLARPMVFDQPDDARWHDCHDQWMFGPLLVAPVLEQGATSRVVELPDGDWVDVWSPSSAPVAGGSRVEVRVDLQSVPMFAQAGTLLVADPEPLAGRGRNWPPQELEVWSIGERPDGSGGSTTLYVDDGITRMNEQGAYCYERVQVADGDIETTRISGGWPSPRLVLASAHAGQLTVPRVAEAT